MKPLSECQLDCWVRVVKILQTKQTHHHADLARRLIEMGFDEGILVCIRHVSPFGQDVLAVELENSLMITLRRFDAQIIHCEECIN